MSLFLPARILPVSPLPGVSLVVSPLLAGLAMHYFGRWQGSRDKMVSPLATFWGGTFFAFGMSVVRYLMITS